MDEFIAAFIQTVESAAGRLSGLPESASEIPPEPGEWSAKEILGHLIDSASHNHRRFVEAVSEDDLVFPGYDQESSAANQNFRKASWANLITLWKAYNLHLAHVFASIPEDALKKPRLPHSLDKISFKPVDKDSPAVLEYLIQDYFEHMKMHLADLDGFIDSPNEAKRLNPS